MILGLFFILSNWCSKFEIYVFPNSNGETIYKLFKSLIGYVYTKLPQFWQIRKYIFTVSMLSEIVEKNKVEYLV